MRDISQGLRDHLTGGVTTLCWCWKVVRKDGTVMGFTDLDEDVVFDNVTYIADSGVSASEISSSLGLNVDNLDVSGALNSDVLETDDILRGVYDDAKLEIFRVNWNDTSQRVLIKSGNMGKITRTNKTFIAEVRGISHKLQQKSGRVYGKLCDVEFGGSKCGVNISDFSHNINVDTIVNNKELILSNDSTNSSYYNNGVLIDFVRNIKYEIMDHTKLSNNKLRLRFWDILPKNISVGDVFGISKSCDKSSSTCKNTYNNITNFRGFPNIPPSSIITQIANATDDNDGNV